MKRISVVIPMYNAQDEIVNALASVIHQTFPAAEIIVVDDGSTDQGMEKVRAFCEHSARPVKYIRQENQGPAAARNRGIREAKGEYVAFLDADDTWEETKLEKQMAKLESSPESPFCFTDMRHVVNGEVIHESYLHERDYRHLTEGQIYENLLRQNFIFTPTVVVKRDIFESIGLFDETLRVSEDYDLWLRIARKFPVCFVDEILVTRRRTGHNTTLDRKLYIRSCIALRQKLLERERDFPQRQSLLRDKLAADRFALAYAQFEDGLFAEARRSFCQILMHGRFFVRSLFYIVLTFLPSELVAGLRGWKQKKVRG